MLAKTAFSKSGVSPMDASLELLLEQSFVSSNRLTQFFGTNSRINDHVPPENIPQPEDDIAVDDGS